MSDIPRILYSLTIDDCKVASMKQTAQLSRSKKGVGMARKSRSVLSAILAIGFTLLTSTAFAGGDIFCEVDRVVPLDQGILHFSEGVQSNYRVEFILTKCHGLRSIDVRLISEGLPASWNRELVTGKISHSNPRADIFNDSGVITQHFSDKPAELQIRMLAYSWNPFGFDQMEMVMEQIRGSYQVELSGQKLPGQQINFEIR